MIGLFDDFSLKDLQTFIDEDFPIGTELTALQREHQAHQAFAEARQRVYIGGEEYFKSINTTMDKENNTKPLVIVGESGNKYVYINCLDYIFEDNLKYMFFF